MSHKFTASIAVVIRSVDQELTHLSGFKYWWLKSVTGYRLDVHCQQCLVGPIDRRFSAQMALNEAIILRGDLVYLCGGSSDWDYSKNFHVAAKLAVGEEFEVETYNGFHVHLYNAKRIDIEPLPDRWQGMSKQFTRCRNYQFAVQMSQQEIMADLLI
jgi:hypothetical protein